MPIGAICRKHGVSYQLYADDTQIYITFHISNDTDRKAALAKIEACVAEIRARMVMHRLKLNDDKTEFVYLVSLNKTKYISIEPITIGDISIPPTSSARNIDVIFDSTSQMDAQVGKVCQACYFWLRNIRRVRSHLTLTATRQIVQSLVISRLDYCNSLLQGLSKYQLARLQRVQNAAVRVIACIPRHEHISEIRMQLHWLPIQQRITYKILLLTFLVVHEKAPEYLSELLVLHKPNREMRSANQHIFKQPHSFTSVVIRALNPRKSGQTANKGFMIYYGRYRSKVAILKSPKQNFCSNLLN